MNKTLRLATITGFLNTAAFVAVCQLFDSDFANSTIDWFSFAAGIFLAADGVYRIRKHKADHLPVQISRLVRILIGADIFIIHLIQFFWGIDAQVLDTPLRQTLIDWTAFSFGIFLFVEAAIRLFTAQERSFADQLSRIVRTVTGTSVFTIHLLQFMR
ncbi:MAG: hypothetical protein GF409_01405 [Candidatus Omnitrophica bacterium]|nr:hypothetical protein [Candidatus Omnitrophota bacterium]